MAYHRPNQAGVANRNWQDGEIAFLRSYETFLTKDHRDLIASGYLHRGATNHPVIILQAGPGRAIVTTVSAYNSAADTNFLPPWRMFAHRNKHFDDFHAFVGTQLPPRSTHDHLRLCNPGAKMNKPQASWVYIKSFFTVPYTVLVPWNRVPQQLRVSKESLIQLRADIQRKYCVQLRDAKSRLTTCSRAAESIPNHWKTQTCQTPQPLQVCLSPSMSHQQHDSEKPEAVELTPTNKPSASVPHDSNSGEDMPNQHITKTPWSQVIAISVASVRPETTHPRSHTAAACKTSRLILSNS